jgi:hypothetical protein
MKRNCLVVVLALAFAVPSFGRMIEPTQATAERQIVQLEQQWMEAMKGRDETTLNRLLGSEFTLAGISDLEHPAVPRSTWIDNTLHHLKVESFSFDKTKVRIFGDTAIVQAVFTWKGVFNNEDEFTDTTLLIDTWLRRGGNWQVVSRLVADYKKPEDAK